MNKNRKLTVITFVLIAIAIISYFSMYTISEHFSGVSDLSIQQRIYMLEETRLVQDYKEKYLTHTKEPAISTDDLFNRYVIIWSAPVEEPPHIAQLKVTTFGGHIDVKLICIDLATLETFAEYPVGSNNMKDTNCFG